MAAVTLKDVAERAGVSIKTVSNVVRDAPRVSEATRKRVLKTVHELGYRPNPSARRLRTGHSGLIGLAVPDLATPYFAELAQHVRAEAAQLGLTVLIEETLGDATEELRLATGVGASLLDGVILSPLRVSPDELAAVANEFPLVLLGERSYERGQVGADHVLIDNVAAARDATAHLVGLGRTRIAAIGVDQQASATSRQRLEGFQLALHEAGVTYDPGSRPPSRSSTGATACWRCAPWPPGRPAYAPTRSSASVICWPSAPNAPCSKRGCASPTTSPWQASTAPTRRSTARRPSHP